MSNNGSGRKGMIYDMESDWFLNRVSGNFLCKRGDGRLRIVSVFYGSNL